MLLVKHKTCWLLLPFFTTTRGMKYCRAWGPLDLSIPTTCCSSILCLPNWWNPARCGKECLGDTSKLYGSPQLGNWRRPTPLAGEQGLGAKQVTVSVVVLYWHRCFPDSPYTCRTGSSQTANLIWGLPRRGRAEELMVMNMHLWDYTQIWQIRKDTSHVYTNSQFSLRNNLLCRYIWKETW